MSKQYITRAEANAYVAGILGVIRQTAGKVSEQFGSAAADPFHKLADDATAKWEALCAQFANEAAD